MEDQVVLTWYQALQLPGLALSLLLPLILRATANNLSQAMVPTLYFTALAAAFFLPLQDILVPGDEVKSILVIAEASIPALSFLLIVQLLMGRVPPLIYWAILVVPIIGGHSLIQATLLTEGETCIYEHVCTAPLTFKLLYEIFSTALIFLLTIAVYNRLALWSWAGDDPRRKVHKYALVMALIILNLAVFGVALGQLNTLFSPYRAALAVTVIRVGFLYIVLSSIFRVFDESLATNSGKSRL